MIDPSFARYLVRRYGTPLYVYDLEQLEMRCSELHALLPAGASLFYSLKANPLPGICAVLADCGCNPEVSSEGELLVAQASGFRIASSLYTGPAKTAGEVARAIQMGVRYFACESLEEVRRLRRSCGRESALLLRVNPEHAAPGGLSMAAAGVQFGTRISDVIRDARSGLQDTAVGIHVFQGTQIPPNALAESFLKGLSVAQDAAEVLGIVARVFDLGGGFPWPFASDLPPPDLTSLGPVMRALSQKVSATTQLWFESGRYLTASSGTLLSKVQQVKAPPDERAQVFLDTGIHHLGGMSGTRRVPHAQMTVVHGDCVANSTPTLAADVFGPLCTPADWLARDALFQRLPMPGDLVQIPNVGAYGLTASLTAFLSRPPPIEILIRGEQVIAAYQLRSGHGRINTSHTASSCAALSGV